MMNGVRLSGFWRIFMHPVMVLLWFICALLLTMGIGFLNTQVRYTVDYQLLFLATVIIIGTAWLMNVTLTSLLKISLFLPLVGIVSFISLLSDLGDELYYWAGFQWHVPWLEPVIYILLAIVFIVMVNALLHAVSGGHEYQQRFVAPLISVPLLFVLAWNFLSEHHYFADASGRTPVFHKGLAKQMVSKSRIKDIDTFLNIDNPN